MKIIYLELKHSSSEKVAPNVSRNFLKVLEGLNSIILHAFVINFVIRSVPYRRTVRYGTIRNAYKTIGPAVSKSALARVYAGRF